MTFPLVVNNFTHPVILADGRSWARSYERHLETTGNGGDDLAYPLNSPVNAPAAGRWELSPYQGQAGNVGRIRMSNGWAVVFEHISGVGMVAIGSKVRIGQVVCHSGNTGGVIAHLHVHLIDPQGARHPIYEYFAKTVQVSGTGKVLTAQAPMEEDEMRLFEIKDEKGKPLYTFANGTFEPVPEGQGGQFAAGLGKATPIGKSTKAAMTSQAAKHYA